MILQDWMEVARMPDLLDQMDLNLDSFRIFGFLDDFAMPTCRPGSWVSRHQRFVHDIQRAFYSGYFKQYGLKAQAVYLPNGMFGSIYISSMAHNDIGTLNLSGLDIYLQELLADKAIGITYPDLYFNAIFNICNTYPDTRVASRQAKIS